MYLFWLVIDLKLSENLITRLNSTTNSTTSKIPDNTTTAAAPNPIDEFENQTKNEFSNGTKSTKSETQSNPNADTSNETHPFTIAQANR